MSGSVWPHGLCGPPGSSVHGFSRQEYWSGLLCPPPGDLLDSRTQCESLMSPALAGRFLPLVPPGKPTRFIPSIPVSTPPGDSPSHRIRTRPPRPHPRLHPSHSSQVQVVTYASDPLARDQICYRSLPTPRLGLINLLEGLIELRKTVYFLD